MNDTEWSEVGWQLLIVLWTLLVIGFAFGVKWLIYPKTNTKERADRILRKRFTKGPLSGKS